MTNPLTIMSPASATGDKPGASQGKERDTKGGFAFEEVLSEDVEQIELKDVDPFVADSNLPSEQSEIPSVSTADSTETIKTDELEPAQLQVAAQEVADAPKHHADFAVGETNHVAAPPSPVQQISQLASENSTLRQNTGLPEAAAPRPDANVLRAPTQVPIHDVSGNGYLHQMPASHALNASFVGDTFSKLEPPSPEPVVPLVARVFEPLEARITQQTVISAALKPQTTAWNLDRAPGDAVAETAISAEVDDLFAVKDTAVGHTIRDTPQAMPIAAARAETARTIAGQLAASISTRPNTGGVEIALNPEELGRVSISLNGREDGFHLSIAAERPETLDLMRRHIAILSAELEKLGYGDLSLDLSMSGDSSQHGDPSEPDPSSETVEMVRDADHKAPTLSAGPERGLDMRL